MAADLSHLLSLDERKQKYEKTVKDVNGSVATEKHAHTSKYSHSYSYTYTLFKNVLTP